MDYLNAGLFYKHKQIENQKIISSWCKENDSHLQIIKPWHLKITGKDGKRIELFTVKETWFNPVTGEKGVYTSIETILNKFFNINL